MESFVTSFELLQELDTLLVEDNPADADFVREALVETGVALDHVTRVGEALGRTSDPPDLILLDLGLPDASGLDGLQRLHEAMPSVPIIILTGLGGHSIGMAAVRNGAEDFLAKSEITAFALRRVMCYAVERIRSRQRDALLAAEQREREEAQRANTSKDRFLAVLSHELRNPLAAVRYAVDILRNPAASAEAIAQARKVMERQLTHLVRMVDDLLDLSRINQNKLKMRKEPTSLALVIESAVDAVTPALSEHRLSLTMPPREVVIDADHARVAQILVNLLNNAGKFTPAGGDIWLDAAAQGENAVITVRDSGVGFNAEAATRLFEMFYQEQNGPRDLGGLGIGLTLAKQIVEMHGGGIEAHSAGPGAGAQFTVWLPQATAERAPASNASPRPTSVKAERAIRVLIVDDNADSADLLSILVSDAGCETRVAYNASTALDLAAQFSPDIGLLDIGLPGMDGYELAARMRQLPECAGTKLVAITGWGQRDDKRRAAEAGFDVHLTKPVAFQQLETLLLASPEGPLPGTTLPEKTFSAPPAAGPRARSGVARSEIPSVCSDRATNSRTL